MISYKLRATFLYFGVILIALLVTSYTLMESLLKKNSRTQCENSWAGDIQDKSNDIDLTLIMEKDKFKLTELIYVDLILSKISPGRIWVNSRMLINKPEHDSTGEIFFKVISPTGEFGEFIARVDAGTPAAYDFMYLQSQQSIVTKSDGLNYYYFWKSANRIGKYCAWAVYSNQTDPGLEGFVWMGKIKSNFVEFEVVAE